MEKQILDQLMECGRKNELQELFSFNQKTQQFGLSLTAQDAKELIEYRNGSLRKYGRVEFGGSILDKLIFAFCDSHYIDQNNYLETLKRLQDIFYRYKNESQDKLTDDELITFMREQYEGVCMGDEEYLEKTCLERFSRAVRSGYTGYEKSQGKGEYTDVDEEQRWDSELYYSVLKELFGE